MDTVNQEPARLPARPVARRFSLALALWLLLLILAGVAVLTNLGEVRKILDVLGRARWEYVLAAAGVEVLFVLNLGLFYASTFRATGVKARLSRLVLIAQGSHFVNLVSKTAGLGGIGLYLQEAKRTGESAARTSVAYMMAFVLGYAGYFAVLVGVLALLIVEGKLSTAEAVAAAIILTQIVVVGGFMLAGIRSEEALERMYLRLATPANLVARLLRRRPFVDHSSSHETVAELYEALESLKRRPGSYVLPFLHALAVEALATALLYLGARSVGAHMSVEHALAAYAISLLFSMIAITPAGLGFVEASLAVLLISFGIERQTAIAAALVYRLFEFWLPVGLGVIALALLHYSWRGQSNE